MCLLGHIEPFDGWRISLGGTSVLGLARFLETHQNVTHCLACVDSDETGERIAANIAELQGTTTKRVAPLYGNDWNDALQMFRRAERTQNRAQRSARDERG
jgi:hypothetical protein